MTLRGLREVETRLNRAFQEIQGATKESLRDIAMDLWGKSVDLVPIDTGDLRGSAKAEPTSATRMEWKVSYGTEYAVVQHEHLEFRHENGGQAKFLQQPFEENVERYIQMMRDSVRRET